MKIRKKIIQALVALAIIMPSVSYSADAQNEVKDKWMAEAKEVFEKQDSTTSILDRCRAFYYGYQRDAEAQRNKEVDFRLVYADRMVTSWNLLFDAKVGVKYEDFEKSKEGLSIKDPADKLTLEAWEFVKTEVYNKFPGRSTKYWSEIYKLNQNLDVPLPFQDISGYIKGMLDKSEQCKSNECKLVCLYRVIVNREKHTVEYPQVIPNDEILYTERIQNGVAALPADLLAKNPLPVLRTAEELFNKRISDAETHKLPFETPKKNRDTALETQIKKRVQAGSPSAKIKAVAFGSDATASWSIHRNAFDIPISRSKQGIIVVEYPGKPGLYLGHGLTATQAHQGGGKYGKSEVSLDNSFIICKEMIFDSNWMPIDLK